jgi:hypothetical protein
MFAALVSPVVIAGIKRRYVRRRKRFRPNVVARSCGKTVARGR